MSEGVATVLGMRFLHTSDWHLGRSLHRFDLREAQAAFLDHLEYDRGSSAQPQRAARRDPLAVRFAVLRSGMVTP